MNDILKIRTTASTARKFRVLAAELGCTQGELVKAIIYLVGVRALTHGTLAQAVAVADQIPEPGFVGDNAAKHIEYLDRVMHHSIAGDDDETAEHFATKAQAVAAGEPPMSPEAGLAIIKAVVHRDEERPLPMNLGDDTTPEAIVTLDSTPERIATLREEA